MSIAELLQEVPPWCKWLRLIWCDTGGVRRCRCAASLASMHACIIGCRLLS